MSRYRHAGPERDQSEECTCLQGVYGNLSVIFGVCQQARLATHYDDQLVVDLVLFEDGFPSGVFNRLELMG